MAAKMKVGGLSSMGSLGLIDLEWLLRSGFKKVDTFWVQKRWSGDFEEEFLIVEGFLLACYLRHMCGPGL